MPASRPGPVRAPDDRKGEDILAKAGVEFDFPHAVMYDILDTSNAGTPRHRVLVEIQGGDFATAVKALEDSLAGLGYEKIRDTNKDGRIEQVFEQAGKPAYYLLMQPAGMGPRLSGPDSAGSIHIMWNITDGT